MIMGTVKVDAKKINEAVTGDDKRRMTFFVSDEVAEEFEENCPKRKMSDVIEELLKLYNESFKK